MLYSLSEGPLDYVPHPVDYFFERKTLMSDVAEQLKSKHYLVLSGMYLNLYPFNKHVLTY